MADIIQRLRYENCSWCSSSTCRDCKDLFAEAANEIERLKAERIELMMIRWPVEEWIDGRITTEQLRETVAPLINK